MHHLVTISYTMGHNYWYNILCNIIALAHEDVVSYMYIQQFAYGL